MLNLSAFIDKTEMIENDIRDNCNRQAVKSLHMWTNEFGDEANQAAMIRAMRSIGCRSQAEGVSSTSLVQHVCPHK